MYIKDTKVKHLVTNKIINIVPQIKLIMYDYFYVNVHNNVTYLFHRQIILILLISRDLIFAVLVYKGLKMYNIKGFDSAMNLIHCP